MTSVWRGKRRSCGSRDERAWSYLVVEKSIWLSRHRVTVSPLVVSSLFYLGDRCRTMTTVVQWRRLSTPGRARFQGASKVVERASAHVPTSAFLSHMCMEASVMSCVLRRQPWQPRPRKTA